MNAKELDELLDTKVKELTIDLKDYQPTIKKDYRASEEDEEPGMQITIATNNDLSDWALQTGDNSYSGPVYRLPHWAVIYLYPDSDCEELAKQAIRDLMELVEIEIAD